jgi:hypothetical protein
MRIQNDFSTEPVKTIVDDLLITKVEVTENGDDVFVNAGILQCNIPKHGNQLIRFIEMDGRKFPLVESWFVFCRMV